MKPRHFAAAHYSVFAVFLIATWFLLLSPFDEALAQIQNVFSQGYETRNLFIFLAIATIISTLLAVMFWLPQAASRPLARLLAIGSSLMLAISIWQVATTLIIGFGVGSAFAFWSWYAHSK